MSSIYVIHEDGGLRALSERGYASEDLLQSLLEQYPEVLAGEQMDQVAPRRWLLVAREIGVPDREGGADRWALDRLFLDQEGVPTLVEVKRSTDTRIRREVVGQMLDYAANAAAYWPAERIRGAFEENARARAEDPVGLVLSLLDGASPDDADAYWDRVADHLDAGRLRLVFVADRVPTELRRIIEFLNQQMSPAEVLGVEVKQYAGGPLRTLVPTVVGQTAAAVQKKRARGANPPWDEARFMAALAESQGAEAAAAAGEVLRWAEAEGLRVWWGRGGQNGSFIPMLDHDGDNHFFASVWSHHGTVEVQFQHMRGPFASADARLALLRRLNGIAGVDLDEARVSARPSFHLSVLADPERRDAFFDIWRDYSTAIVRP